VLHALRNNEQLARLQGHAAISETNRNPSFEDEEEVIGVVMLVPHEFSFDPGHHEIVAVELTNGSRLPVLSKRRKLLGEIDCIHFLPPIGEQ
jgi:hypothetical protein